MLKKVTTQNYKNLSLEDGLELGPLNILVGPNGSGKSNFIAMIQFFKMLFGPQSLRPGVTEFELATHQLGGSKILDSSLASPNSVSFQVEYHNRPTERGQQLIKLQFKLGLLIRDARQPVLINEESIYDIMPDLTLPIYEREGEAAKVANVVQGIHGEVADGLISEARGVSYTIHTSSHSYPANRLILPQLSSETVASYIDEFPADYAYHLAYKLFGEAIIYNANVMDLHQIRTDEPKIGALDLFLSESGDNLASVLDSLVQENLDFEETLNQAMQAILPDTRRVRPIRAGRLSLTIEWHITGMKTPFYLDEMSDGTVRMLCWATVLLHPNPPRLLVIEEPELGIHVAWLPILADWIKQAAQKTQVIISTHSPDLLDQFSDCVENVYVFHPRPQDKSHFTVKRLAPQDVENWFAEGWQLGDLYRVGDPSVGGWPW